MIHYYVEKKRETVIRNGHYQEKITNQRNDNGRVTIEKKIYKGIVENGKLRKKKVTFMPKLEYIEPGYEEYECKQPSFKNIKKRKPKKKTKQRKYAHKANRSLKK